MKILWIVAFIQINTATHLNAIVGLYTFKSQSSGLTFITCVFGQRLHFISRRQTYGDGFIVGSAIIDYYWLVIGRFTRQINRWFEDGSRQEHSVARGIA